MDPYLFTDFYNSPLGQLKITCDKDSVKSVHFTEQQTMIPTNPNELVISCIQQLDEYFKGQRQVFDLPLSQEGTTFQKKVWDLLYKIPFGKTLSYMELAKQYGDMKAIRAIASANGRNNIAVIIPCHRVIGSNRSLTGYAGGLWRKQWLLDHESSHHSSSHQLSLEW